MDPIIKKIDPKNWEDQEQFIELIRVFEDVFEMKDCSMPSKGYLQKVLAKPNFIAMVAIYQDKVIGGLTAYILDQYYSTKPLCYIYDLAVLREYQYQGVGKKLIAAIKEDCHQNGFAEVFVQADRVDDYALDFYRSTGITAEEDVLHFYYTLND